MKFLINYPENSNKDLLFLRKVLIDKISAIENAEIFENKDVSKPSEYKFIINIGYNYRIIAETFKILHRIVPANAPKVVLYNPAGESWFDTFNVLTQRAIDAMGCEARARDYVYDFWSLKDLEKFIDFSVKTLAQK